MTYERLMGFMWGIIGGGAIVAAIYINPLMLLFLPVAFGFNYGYGRD